MSDAIEQAARYLQVRNATDGLTWEEITERGREVYRQRARELRAILVESAENVDRPSSPSRDGEPS